MRTLDFSDPPLLMGVVNVTPDSFSDGGAFLDADSAIAHARCLVAEGADILDIGGESTRPGATPVSVDDECARVLPVIEGLKNCGAIISIDTRHAETMRAAVASGAGMINDVTALMGDEHSLSVAAESGVYICLMHMQGTPQTMQNNPVYDDVVEDVFAFLKHRMDVCVEAGISKDRLLVDPGIGFGKTLEQNLKLLTHLERFQDLGAPVLLGASRKSFIGKVANDVPVQDRLPGSLAVALDAAAKGVQVLRVHDVAETRQALAVNKALRVVS